jgi:hypothetical protein
VLWGLPRCRSWLAAARGERRLRRLPYDQRFDHVAEVPLAPGKALMRGAAFFIASRGSLSDLQTANHRGGASKALASMRSLALGRQLIVAGDDEIGKLAVTLRGQFPREVRKWPSNFAVSCNCIDGQELRLRLRR